jgi:hypothetical protein
LQLELKKVYYIQRNPICPFDESNMPIDDYKFTGVYRRKQDIQCNVSETEKKKREKQK